MKLPQAKQAANGEREKGREREKKRIGREREGEKKSSMVQLIKFKINPMPNTTIAT